MQQISILVLIMSLFLWLPGCGNSNDENNSSSVNVTDEGVTSVNHSNLESQLESIQVGELTQQEIDGLLFMREEEKLAHDVYTVLYDIWGQRIFTNIASAESTHTEAVLLLLNRYGLVDPVEDNAVGVFSNIILQELNDDLVDAGSFSLIDALLVGAAIEEIDMLDIQRYIDQVEANDDIILVYENLLKGSRNHLRSFVSSLEKQGIVYTPQYIDQADYDAIINSDMEKG